MARYQVDITEGPLLGKIVRYSVPLMLTGILQLLFNAADLVVVGRYCGSVSVAAIGATGAVINLLVNLFIGLSVGAGVLVAHGIGAKDNEAVHEAVHTAIPTAFISGLALTAIGVSTSAGLLRLMGTPDDVIGLSTVYMRIYFCGMTASMLYNFGASVMRAAGDTRSPLLFLTVSGVLNVLLNLVFVTVFKMDVAGVALATVLSQAVSAALVLTALSRRDDACRFIPKASRIRAPRLLEMLRIGVPAGIQGALFSISNVIIQSSINSFGSVVMSGNAATQNIEGFVYVSMNAFQQTAVNFVGQNYGAKKLGRIARIEALCLACVSAVGLVFGGGAFLLGKPLLSIYITDSAEAIGYGLIRLRYIALPYLVCGIMDVTTGALRGLGASFAPMAICVAGVCGIRLLWIFTVFRTPQYHTPQVLYLSYIISWTVTFAAELTVFLLLLRRKKRAAQPAAST